MLLLFTFSFIYGYVMEATRFLDNFRENIRMIISLYKKQKEENANLKILINEQKQTLALKEKEINELKERSRTVDLAKGFLASSAETRDAKNKINAIVREIDNCIALLNR